MGTDLQRCAANLGDLKRRLDLSEAQAAALVTKQPLILRMVRLTVGFCGTPRATSAPL